MLDSCLFALCENIKNESPSLSLLVMHMYRSGFRFHVYLTVTFSMSRGKKYLVNVAHGQE